MAHGHAAHAHAPQGVVARAEDVHTHKGSGHDHHGHGDHGHDHSAAPRRVLAIAFAITAAFMFVEAAVGIWSGSLALLADAGHMLADAGALALALVAQHWAAKSRTERSTFGFHRAEVLAAFVNGIALSVTALLIVSEAVERWLSPEPIHGTSMLITAALGLCVNLVVAATLMRAQRESLNVRAAFAHVLMDALGSVAAIVAGLLVVFTGTLRADPVLSVLIALFVAYSGWRVMKETTRILLEAVPAHLDTAAIERTILDCAGVAGLHDLHIWRISDKFDTLTVHVTLARGAHGTDVCRIVSDTLEQRFGLSHVTIQPEAPPPDELVAVRTSRDGGPARHKKAG
ncbi:MAG TPA: cation diffusion facilitator family transporter [Polyangiaceae bacterium]